MRWFDFWFFPPWNVKTHHRIRRENKPAIFLIYISCIIKESSVISCIINNGQECINKTWIFVYKLFQSSSSCHPVILVWNRNFNIQAVKPPRIILIKIWPFRCQNQFYLSDAFFFLAAVILYWQSLLQLSLRQLCTVLLMMHHEKHCCNQFFKSSYILSLDSFIAAMLLKFW